MEEPMSSPCNVISNPGQSCILLRGEEMIGHLILLIGKNTSGQKGHLQSVFLAETSSKNLEDTLVKIQMIMHFGF